MKREPFNGISFSIGEEFAEYLNKNLSPIYEESDDFTYDFKRGDMKIINVRFLFNFKSNADDNSGNFMLEVLNSNSPYPYGMEISDHFIHNEIVELYIRWKTNVEFTEEYEEWEKKQGEIDG